MEGGQQRPEGVYGGEKCTVGRRGQAPSGALRAGAVCPATLSQFLWNGRESSQKDLYGVEGEGLILSLVAEG